LLGLINGLGRVRGELLYGLRDKGLMFKDLGARGYGFKGLGEWG